jgi:hypothetical protein
MSIITLFALILMPTTAFSMELFEGNWGYEGNWLHVLGSPSGLTRDVTAK